MGFLSTVKRFTIEVTVTIDIEFMEITMVLSDSVADYEKLYIRLLKTIYFVSSFRLLTNHCQDWITI